MKPRLAPIRWCALAICALGLGLALCGGDRRIVVRATWHPSHGDLLCWGWSAHGAGSNLEYRHLLSWRPAGKRERRFLVYVGGDRITDDVQLRATAGERHLWLESPDFGGRIMATLDLGSGYFLDTNEFQQSGRGSLAHQSAEEGEQRQYPPWAVLGGGLPVPRVGPRVSVPAKK